MKAVEAVIFDLDGTLIQSEHDYQEMARRVEKILRGKGVPESRLSQSRKVWEIVFGGIDSLKEMGFSPEERRRTLDLINEALNAVELLSLCSVEPMPGAHETLRSLKQLGLKIGIATRSGVAYAERSLKIAALTEYVDVLLARDEVEHPKPDPRHLLQVVKTLEASPEKVVYVGDTTTDQLTAREAGIAFIGFPRNDEWRKQLTSVGCAVLVDHLREITCIIEGGLHEGGSLSSSWSSPRRK